MRLAETNIVRHAYSHFKITLHTYLCRYKSGTARPLACDAVKWIAPKSIICQVSTIKTNTKINTTKKAVFDKITKILVKILYLQRIFTCFIV